MNRFDELHDGRQPVTDACVRIWLQRPRRPHGRELEFCAAHLEEVTVRLRRGW